jgi:hypothetical protein
MKWTVRNFTRGNRGRPQHSIRENDILEMCEKIESYLNDHQFLHSYRIKFMNEKKQNVIYMAFQLYEVNAPEEVLVPISKLNDNHTYCTVKIISTFQGNYKKMEIQYVHSNLRHGVGMFLMYLFLLIAYLSNITDIVLDNYTSNPVLATQGIYKLFRIDRRGHSPNAFKGLSSLNEKLNASQGAMRLVMYSNFLSNWVSDLINLQEKTIGNQSPWTQDPPYEEKLKAFVAYLKQNYSLPSIPHIHTISKSSRGINKTKKKKNGSVRSDIEYDLHNEENNEEENQSGGGRKRRHTRKKSRTRKRKHETSR